MTTGGVAERLGALRLFRGADVQDFVHMARQPGVLRRAAAGEVLFRSGDPADAIYAAMPGTGETPRSIVEVQLPLDSGGPASHYVAPGDVFGEFEFVAAGLDAAGLVRRSSARTLVACELLRIPLKLLSGVLAQTESVRARLIRLSVNRLLTTINTRSELHGGDRDVAFARWLLDTADSVGAIEGQRVRLPASMSQGEMAAALGVARETISLRLNDWERAGLVRTGSPSRGLEILDYGRVALRARINKHDAYASIDAALGEIDAELDRGELIRARNIGLDLLGYFPASPDLRHRVALADIRSGATDEAMVILGQAGLVTGGDIDLLRQRVRLGLRHPGYAANRLLLGVGDEAGEVDEWGEGPSLEQRCRMLIEDLAAIEARAQKELSFAAPSAEARQAGADRSVSLYEAIFDAVGGSYSGINAAMMALVSGDEARARRLARRVALVTGAAPASYWAAASLAEAQIILGDAGAAFEIMSRAGRLPDASTGKMSSTRRQVRRLIPLAAAGEAALAALPAGQVGAFALANDGEAALVAPAAVTAAALREADVRVVYVSIGSAEEIAVAETVIRAGLSLHLVLPTPVEAVAQALARQRRIAGDAVHWNERLNVVLGGATSWSVASDWMPLVQQFGSAHRHAARVAAGLALMRADALSTSCVHLGTAPRPATAGHPGSVSADEPFRAVLFVWAMQPDRTLSGLANDLAATLEVPILHSAPRRSADRRPGVAIVLDSVGAALSALTLGFRGEPWNAGLRLIADYGAVLGRGGALRPSLVARLSAASDLAGMPSGRPLATTSFAAIARLEGLAERRLLPVHRVGGDALERHLAAQPVFVIKGLA